MAFTPVGINLSGGPSAGPSAPPSNSGAPSSGFTPQGIDLSGNQPSVGSDAGFWGSQSVPSSSGLTQANTSAPSSSPQVSSGGQGFWGSLMNMFTPHSPGPSPATNMAKGISTGILNTPGTQSGNALQSAGNWLWDLPGRIQSGLENSTKGMQAATNLPIDQIAKQPSFGQTLSQMASNFAQGYSHPEQAQTGKQSFDNYYLGGKGVPVESAVGGFLTNMGTNPMSYVPIPITAVSKAVGLTPLLEKGITALKASPLVKNSAVQGVKDTLGNMFVKHYGTSPDTSHTLNELEGSRAADKYAIQSKMSDMAKTHNLNAQQLDALPHVWEGTMKSTDPQVLGAVKDLQDVQSQGFQSAHGKVFGTDAEARPGFTGQPIRQGWRPDYFSHQYNNTPDEINAALQNAGKQGLSTNGSFNQSRTFPTLAEAQAHGLSPEMNPYVAVGNRLADTSKSIRTDDAIKQLVHTGVVSKSAAPGLVESTIKPFDAHISHVPDTTPGAASGATTPILQKYYMKPADHSAIQNSISPPVTQNSFLKAADKVTGAWKNVTLLNSLVHGHNIGYNGAYLGGANLPNAADTMKNLFTGSHDPWYEKALYDNAVSSDGGGKGAFVDQLRNAVTGKAGAINNAKDAAGYALHGSLWDADKSLRSSLYRGAVEKGSSGTDAAVRANKFMVNYNNTTPFENNVMKRIFPFYSWMKGNLPLQADQWLNNTGKQTAYEVAKNSANQTINNGQPMGADGKIDTGIKLKDGSHVKIDPYSPADEPLKMLHDGILPFLYSKANPILKEGIDQLTNHAYYPGSPLAPPGKEAMAGTQIRQTGLPGSVNLRSSLAHALTNILPLSGILGSAAGGLVGGTDGRGALDSALGMPSKNSPPTTLAEYLTKALGGFTSRDNPAMDDYYKQKDAQTNQQNLLKYDKQAGIPVSKGMTRQAYRKIRYPGS